jgi:hypothetical protein
MLLDAGLSFEEAQTIAEYSYIDSLYYGIDGVTIYEDETVSGYVWDHFAWSDTPQGYTYWLLIANRYVTTQLIPSLYAEYEELPY